MGPTAKQPQLEILHSLDLETKDLGIATETDALAENTRSKGASELTQPKHSLASRQGSEHPLSRVINCESATHPALWSLHSFIYSPTDADTYWQNPPASPSLNEGKQAISNPLKTLQWSDK